MFFRDKTFAIFRNRGPAKPRSHGHAIFRNLGPAKPRSRGHAISGILSPQSLGVMNTRKSRIPNRRSHELRKTENSGICKKSGSGVANGEIHEPVRSKVKVVVPKSPDLECELVAGL
jgi:hypothetical protein